MLLFLVLDIFFSFVGFSAGVVRERLCYGEKLTLPLSVNTALYKGPLYFTPKGGSKSSTKIIMNNGQSDHPRLKTQYYSTFLTDLRNTDEGTFSILQSNNAITDILTLEILDCADEIDGIYGESFSIYAPREAQYLEFTPLVSKETTVLWNRTGPQVNREKVKKTWDTIDVSGLTHADNGYYNLRRKDNTLLTRKKLRVEAKEVHLEVTESEHVSITLPKSTWVGKYTPDAYDDVEDIIIESGLLVTLKYGMLKRRLSKWGDDLEIAPVEARDSGNFNFWDKDDNLIQTVRLEVSYATLPTYVYIVVLVVIILALIGCCCCVKKCCCKKRSSKGNEPAPAVQRQDQTQPFVTYSVEPAARPPTYQPVRPVAPSQPAAYSPGHSVAAPSQPTVSPGVHVQPSPLSTDADPKFELKGSLFPSASMLSSESTSDSVYTSAKLNFL